MAKRKLLIIDPAAKMKNFRPIKRFCGELPLQRSVDIVPVFQFVGIGQPYGDDKQLLPILKGTAPQGFRKAQDAASMLLMLESGAGITVGPQGAFQENGHLVARTIEGCGEFGSWRALFRRGKVNPLVGALLDIIKEMDKRDGD